MRALFGQLLSPPTDFQFRIKLILAHNATKFHSKSTKNSIHSLISTLNLKLSAYNISQIPVIGKCSLSLEHKSKLLKVSFLVVDTKSVPILGLELCKNLKLIKCIYSIELKENSLLSEFSDCLWEIGTLNKIHQIEIKENFTPVVTPVRQIPHSLKPKVEKELKSMVDLNIIESVDQLIGS